MYFLVIGESLLSVLLALLRLPQRLQLFEDALFSAPIQIEELTLPPKERKAYEDFEKSVQQDYIAVRCRLLYERGSHTMAVIALLSKLRQVALTPGLRRKQILNEQARIGSYQ